MRVQLPDSRQSESQKLPRPGRAGANTLARVNFRITRHSGSAAPENALALLWERLDARHEGVSFAREGTEIRARWGDDAPVSMERDEREEIGRGTVLAIVRGTCDGAPDLKYDWFAVSAYR
jgi:hypothetical protein